MKKAKRVNIPAFDIASKVGIFAGSLMIAVTIACIYSPVIKSHALNSASEDVQIRLNVAPSISISIDASALNLNTSVNQFVSDTVNVNVSTNSQYGYTLTLEDADDSANMVHENSSISDVVTSTFSGTKTSSTMDGNTWGYSLNSTDFRKVPVYGSADTIRTSNGPVNTNTGYETTAVDFGAKVGPILAAGTYVDIVQFTAYVNGQDGNPLRDDIFAITNMQEMTPAVCSETTTPLASATTFDWDGSHRGDNTYVPRTVLTDTRDSNTYVVSKLADGNCWMSQNLALDLTANTPIIASRNDGTTFTATPDFSTQTNASGTSWFRNWEDQVTWRSYKPQTSASFFQGGVTAASSPSGLGDQYAWEATGNYYNLYAATAGTGPSLEFQSETFEATGSICPQGWRLPSLATGTKSFRNLIATTYNIDTVEDLDGEWVVASVNPVESPLNYVLASIYMGANDWGGWIDSDSFGIVGSYYSSTIYQNTQIEENDEIFVTNSSRPLHVEHDVYDGEEYNSFVLDYLDGVSGFSIRCVAI